MRPTGCLGYCSQGPNAAIRKGRGNKKETTKIQVEIRSLEASARVVERASGQRPNLDDPDVEQRFSKLREGRIREEAKSNHHWNAALRGLEEKAAADPSLRGELEILLEKAGYIDPEMGRMVIGTSMPISIQNYTKWTLETVRPVSKHSAVYTLTCKDRKRSTPHPRGRGRQVDPITFHTTLLAEVGANEEGPLPWVEREYTPVR